MKLTPLRKKLHHSDILQELVQGSRFRKIVCSWRQEWCSGVSTHFGSLVPWVCSFHDARRILSKSILPKHRRSVFGWKFFGGRMVLSFIIFFNCFSKHRRLMASKKRQDVYLHSSLHFSHLYLINCKFPKYGKKQLFLIFFSWGIKAIAGSSR